VDLDVNGRAGDPPIWSVDVAERWSRVFDVVATAGSFTGAVRRLGLASPR
jgi:hypothetical protein